MAFPDAQSFLFEFLLDILKNENAFNIHYKREIFLYVYDEKKCLTFEKIFDCGLDWIWFGIPKNLTVRLFYDNFNIIGAGLPQITSRSKLTSTEYFCQNGDRYLDQP